MGERIALPAALADFTSALYLGLRHPAGVAGGWDALTLGKPAALQEPPGAAELARQLAQLQDCAAATLLPSTLHLFWDLFGMLAQERVVVLIDGAAYPIARWGAERAAALGIPVRAFARAEVAQAEQLARHWLAAGRRPVILADGYNPGAPHAPPLAGYAAIAARGKGYLVLDDTQVLGVLGAGGGGSVRLHGLQGAPLLVGASLAKGFGAPLAALSGSHALVARFEAHSQARIHASPPSAAAIGAAQRALRLNRAAGDGLRQRLRQRVAALRTGLAAAGIACRGGAFPVQTVLLPAAADGPALHAALRRCGVEVLLQAGARRMALAFLLRADHTGAEIGHAVEVLEHQLGELA